MAKYHKFGDCGNEWRLAGSGDKCTETCVSLVGFFCLIIRAKKVAIRQLLYGL
jgi:hypothetical protein